MLSYAALYPSSAADDLALAAANLLALTLAAALECAPAAAAAAKAALCGALLETDGTSRAPTSIVTLLQVCYYSEAAMGVGVSSAVENSERLLVSIIDVTKRMQTSGVGWALLEFVFSRPSMLAPLSSEFLPQECGENMCIPRNNLVTVPCQALIPVLLNLGECCVGPVEGSESV